MRPASFSDAELAELAAFDAEVDAEVDAESVRAPVMGGGHRQRRDPAVLAAVGALIAGRRMQRGWTRPDFARRSGFARKVVWDFETGRACPSVTALYDLAAALGCEATDLLPLCREIEAERAAIEWDAVALKRTDRRMR